MIRTLLSAVLAAFAVSTTAFAHGADAHDTPPTAQVPPIEYRERTLGNGMKVLTSLDTATPNVSVQVWYGVGSKDDPVGRSGFAHLFEHLMFKATRDMPAETIDRLTEDAGGFNNAFTADDMTTYYEVVPANHLEQLLWAEAQRMGSLVVDEATFVSERDVVKEELRQRVLADPYGRFARIAIPQAAFAEHPYMRPGIGNIDELDAATIDDVLNFHRTYYRPDNAALIVVGNFDEAQLDAWIDQYFGPMTAPAEPLPVVTAIEPERTEARTVMAYGPNVPLPAVAITWLAPPASSEDASALEVLDAILSGGKSSRLYNTLVYDRQIAQAAYSVVDLRAQPGLFYVAAILAGGQEAATVQQALSDEVARLRAAPPTAAELTEAKNELVATVVRDRETIDGRAMALGIALLLQGDADRANSDIAALQAVTAADVQRVAQTYLPADRAVAVRYVDEAQRAAGYDAAAPVVQTAASTEYDGPVVALRPEAEREPLPPLSDPIDPVLPTAVERRLGNRLRVIVARDADLPLVTAELIVASGASADPDGLAGTATMTADLMTQGTKTRSATEISQQIEALGAKLSTGSGWESSSVSLNVMTDNLEAAMAIMADVARNPVFADDEIERTRGQALDGLKVAYQKPGSVAGFAAAPLIYAGTPFGHVAEGTPGSLAKISRDDLVTMHRTYWRPTNAILVITGDVTPEEGFELAQAAFGDWPLRANVLPFQAPVDLTPNPRAVIIDMPDSGQAAVVAAKTAIVRSDPRYYAGMLANDILGGGYSARLNQEIRVKRGLSYGARSSLSAREKTGAFVATTQTKNESAAEVVILIREEMAKMAATAPDAAEIKARKSVLVGSYGRALATTDGLAGILGNLALYGIPLSEVQAYTGKVEAVTPEQVRSFAAEVFDPAQASFIVVGDAEVFGDAMGTVLPGAQIIPLGELDLDSQTLRTAP